MRKMFLFVVLFVGLAASLSVPYERKGVEIGPTSFDSKIVSDWMKNRNLEPITDADTIPSAFRKTMGALKVFATETLKELEAKNSNGDEILVDQTLRKRINSKVEENDYPFWQFIPADLGMIVPSAAPLTWSGKCFQNSSAVSSLNSDGSLDIVLTFENPKDLICSDLFLLGTVEQYSIQEIVLHGTKKITWKPHEDATSAQKWDLQTNGVRLFLFGVSWATVLDAVAATANLFEPCATQAVATLEAEQNLKFLRNYANITMTKRNVTDVILDKSLINSGDFFGVIRLDGLDPMLGWAMGSTTGHTTVALWGDDGELYVCESTANTSYWHVNGIQKTPYLQWLANAKAASFQVVHVPLSPEVRANFNVTAAWEFFNSTEGYDYGYYNLLWGWVDTVKDNYPCAPPDFERCLSWNLIVVAFPQIEKVTVLFTQLYQQAWNLRIGTSGLGFAEILYEANQQGIAADTIPTIVEQDTWMYNTTRNGVAASGPSMVCCAFVCRVWKSGGVFASVDNDINCGEFTNWDDHVLNIFDSNYVRPQVCVDADPDNQACQLLGDYTLNLNNYNSKAIYHRMDEHCPSLPPNYVRVPGC